MNIDKRARYVMEEGYCRSDYTFKQKFPESINGVENFYGLVGLKDEWVVTGEYIYKWESGHGSDRIFVFNNLKGIQVESCGFGWRRITTQHEKDLKERKEYEAFLEAFSALKCPQGLSRWHSDVIEMFCNQHEDILYYGDEE